MSGNKTIELRLYDEKRQAIELGDRLVFINRDAPALIINAQVIGLLRYRTFHELFSHNDLTKFGGDSIAWLENQVRAFYTLEDEEQCGVVGIVFEIV